MNSTPAIQRLLVAAWIGLASGAPAAAQYVDTQQRCIRCHVKEPEPNQFCGIQPGQIWAADDKHNRAFYLLHENADPVRGPAKQALVGRILGFDLRDVFTDDKFQALKADANPESLRQIKSCLRCHATWPQDADQPTAAHEPPVALDLGVSCQACHGPGRLWDQPHSSPSWHLVTPAGKQALLTRDGKLERAFYDVRSTASKAKLCVSCHVGDASQGKFVTHDWYAKGHPPLPSFELATFESKMPAHWNPLNKKTEFPFRTDPPAAAQFEKLKAELYDAGVPKVEGNIRRTYLEANFPDATALRLDPYSDLPATKDAIVAGVVTLQAYLGLISAKVAPDANGTYPGPEFALYDCAACHHPLKSEVGFASRPKRNSPPGRPPPARWPVLLAQLAAQQAARYDPAAAQARWSPIEQQLLELERATTEQPFGNPAAMRTAAAALSLSLDQLAKDAANTPFNDVTAKQASLWLTDRANLETNDYATARQAAWALQQLATHLKRPDAKSLFAADQRDPLWLHLPSGQQGQVIDNLQRWLPIAAAYNPQWFRDELAIVREKLAKPD